MAVKVSNQDCRMRKDWWQICVAPVFSWWFVDVGNVVSAHTNGMVLMMHNTSFLSANVIIMYEKR